MDSLPSSVRSAMIGTVTIFSVSPAAKLSTSTVSS